MVGFHFPVRSPNQLLGNVVRLASDTGSSHHWLASLLRWIIGPLRSTRIARLLHYYRPVRPFAPHRYSAPNGSATWSSPLTSERRFPRSAQEPELASRRLYAGHRPGSYQVASRTWSRTIDCARFR